MRFSTFTLAIMALLAPTPTLSQSSGSDPVPGREAGQPTSDRTPQQKTITPLDQTTQTKQGATSDRTPSNNDMQKSMNRSDTQESSQSSQAQGGPNTGRPSLLTPAKLRESLEKAGFKDIAILDAAYLVHARNSDGDLIVMTINPPTVATTSTLGSSGESSSSSSQEGRGYNPEPGSSQKPSGQ